MTQTLPARDHSLNGPLGVKSEALLRKAVHTVAPDSYPRRCYWSSTPHSICPHNVVHQKPPFL